MREIVHIQAGQCGNQIGAKVRLGSHFLGKDAGFQFLSLRDILFWILTSAHRAFKTFKSIRAEAKQCNAELQCNGSAQYFYLFVPIYCRSRLDKDWNSEFMILQ